VNTRPLGRAAPQIAAGLEERGVRGLPVDAYRLRLVTHRDVNAEQIEHALEVIAEVFGAL
jgi:threonine aldolase